MKTNVTIIDGTDDRALQLKDRWLGETNDD